MSRWHILLLLTMAACQRVGLPAPVSLAPCHAPRIDTRDWKVVSDTTGVSFRVPPTFVEDVEPSLPYRAWEEPGGDPSGRVAIGFSQSREFWLTLRRAPSPGMHEMSECVERVSGREVLLQSWRTEGGIFREYRRQDRFDVMALVQVEPTRTLFVSGGGSDPRFQALLLAIARTVEVSGPPWR